jgi:CubicO group peptidase (beta-lactamase class C family)
MWAEIVKHTSTFHDAVLSAPDTAGYPCSVRCRPGLDAAARVVRVTLPPGVELRPGPASLLCHSHDEELWGLRSCNVRGTLERDEQGWLLRPHQFIPGGGTGGALGTLRLIRDLRRTAARYLQKRGLPRPAIPWSALAEVKAAAKAGAGGDKSQ